MYPFLLRVGRKKCNEKMEPPGEKGKRGTKEVYGRVEEGQAGAGGTGRVGNR